MSHQKWAREIVQQISAFIVIQKDDNIAVTLFFKASFTL